jgi:hypothetical protein
MGNSKKQSKQVRPIKGMNQDVLPSLQATENEYRFALNAVKKTDNESGFGLSNESGNALHVEMPDGYEVRGLAYIEESNKYIVFLHDGSKNQIGIIDEDNRTYTEIVNDTNSKNQLGFSYDEWIDCEYKYVTKGQCKHLIVYWSNSDMYKYADLDDKCCDYSDILLFDCICPTVVKSTVQENGGQLPNGSYQFAIQLEDEDNNTTNFGKISNPVTISDGDNIAGELSTKSINILVSNLSDRYNRINLAVIKTVNGITTTKIIKDNFYGGGQFSYLYTGDTGREIDMPLTSIIGRKNRYIKGKNLHQYNSRLILYNTKPIANLDYQRTANKIKVGFNQYIVPNNMAKHFSQFTPREDIFLAIQWNYCDNTSSAAFPLINRAATASELELIKDDTCVDCDLPRWKMEDTSIVDKIYLKDIRNNTGTFNDDISVKAVPRQPVPDPNSPIGDYEPNDIPNLDNIVTDAMNTKDKKKEDELDCVCDKLQDLKAEIALLPPNRQTEVLANADLQELFCICANRR